MPRTVWLFVLVLAVGAANAPSTARQTGRIQPRVGPFTRMISPTPVGAAQPNLAIGQDGRVWLSWLEPGPTGGHRFRLSSLERESWSVPVTIAEGTNFLANWADFPSVFAAADGTLAAHWLERGESRSSYGVRLRLSNDGGRTWSRAMTPHRDASPTEHGFVSFFDAPGGNIGLVWLDGRDTAKASGSMTLRATTVRNGELDPDTLVDPRVCDCCQTSAARTSSGVVVAYRDRSDREVRDISLATFRSGRWTTTRVYADGWQINGCPVNGPAVAASGRNVAVAWFTGAGDTPRVNVAFSSDEGATFSSPVRIDAAKTLGRLHAVMPEPGRVLVSSLERTEDGARIIVRDVNRDGRLGDPILVTPASPDRSGGFARMALAGHRLVVAWTEVAAGEPPRVAVASGVVR
jgi:hypothetical protein